ncbi:NAD-dependent DNA ligase LigA, partial [Streptomyces sp. NPDC001193]
MTENSALLSPAAYVQAVTTAVAASAAYYGDGTTPLGDDEYDGLLRAIAAYEEAHPDEALAESPTAKVAGGAVDSIFQRSVDLLHQLL